MRWWVVPYGPPLGSSRRGVPWKGELQGGKVATRGIGGCGTYRRKF